MKQAVNVKLISDAPAMADVPEHTLGLAPVRKGPVLPIRERQRLATLTQMTQG